MFSGFLPVLLEFSERLQDFEVCQDIWKFLERHLMNFFGFSHIQDSKRFYATKFLPSYI